MPMLTSVYDPSAPLEHEASEDDWEAAYDRDEQQQTESHKNAKLWRDANAPKPVYSIFTSSSTASRPPPSAALNEATTNGPPQLKILRRPTSSIPSPSSSFASSTNTPRGDKTLAEREKEYAEARRRIYGEEGEEKDMASKLQNGMSKLSLASRSPSRGGKRRSESRASSPRPSATAGTPAPASSAAPSPPPAGSSILRAPKGPSSAGGGFGGSKG
ncbi:hypothetical protein JCM11641_004652 [Rhodosporidiobolus odoratus]